MLQLQNITKSYAGIPALSLSLTLQKREFCVVVGSNGSGKSTLMKTIMGEISHEGKILLNQQDISQLPTYQRAKLISSVIQDPAKGTIPEMTLLENLSLSLHAGKKASFTAYQKNALALKDKIASLNVGLEQYMDTKMSSLSGGQRQLIALVMATLCPPQLLLLDEPCSALDPKTQQQTMTYTQKIIVEQHLTAMMITHHLSDALRYGNRLIMLHKGKIVLDLNAEQKKALTLPQLLKQFHLNDTKGVSLC